MKKTEIDSLTIKLEGKDDPHRIDGPTFGFMVNEIMAILGILGNKTLRWSFSQIQMRSPCEATCDGAPKKGLLSWQTGVGDRFVDVASILESGDGQLSPLQRPAAERMAAMVKRTSPYIKPITFQSPNRNPVSPSHSRIKKNLPKLVDQGFGEFDEWIALEGTLESVTRRGGNRIVIYDQLTNTAVECRVPEQKMAEALDLLKLGTPRVTVYGKAHYRDTRPRHIFVETFEQLPDAKQHPGLKAVQGIDIRV